MTSASATERVAGAVRMTIPAAAPRLVAAAALGLLYLSAAPRIVAAQAAPVQNADLSMFRRLDLPAPNRYRSASGMPGPAYWQQRASYSIRASLDTVKKAVSGEETIRYENHSPDTLRFVWLQIDQNLYRPDSWGATLFPEGARFGGGGFSGGIDIARVSVDGAAAEPHIQDTDMRVDLPRPLAPGDSVSLGVAWSFPVPEHGSDRMGRQGSLYEVAQWFPRMVVYDDVHGWNVDPYLGQGEFYREFGDYDVAVTVPASYVVAATGTLQNPQQVLTATERERLAKAARATSQVAIIAAGEAGMAATRPATSGTLTWRFRAHDVHDFAWAASPAFRWDAMTSKRGVLCQSYYQAADTAWATAADMTCFSIDEFSDRWFPFPWPQATSVAGPVGGMEYPMIVFVHGGGPSRGVFGTIAHEHGHEWFPMIVSSNERRYAWMDEGFNTFIDTWPNDRRYPGTDTKAQYLAAYFRGLEQGEDEPIMTPPDRIDPQALGLVGYRKPAMVLHLLRDQVLGPETFDLAFRTYVRRWAFRHPTPADFMRTMEDVSGRDLDWFFREWLFTTDQLDQAITGVEQKRLPDGRWSVSVQLESQTPLVMPVDLSLTLAGGATRLVELPAFVWYRGRHYVYTTTLPDRLAAATIDAAGAFPDVDRTDNAWTAAAAEH